MDNNPKPPSRLQLVMFLLLIAAGVSLLFFALFTPPEGEIHSSVLIAFAQILTFTGTGLGIDYNYKFKYFRDSSALYNAGSRQQKRKKDKGEAAN